MIQIKPPRNLGDRSGELLTDEKIKAAIMEDYNELRIKMLLPIGFVSFFAFIFVICFFHLLTSGEWISCIVAGILGALILTGDAKLITWIRSEKSRRMNGQFTWRLAKVVEKKSGRGENGRYYDLHLEQNDLRFSNPEILKVKASMYDTTPVGSMVYVIYFKTNKLVAGSMDYTGYYPDEPSPKSMIVRCDFCGTANPYGQTNCKNCGAVLKYANDYITMQKQDIELQQAQASALEADAKRSEKTTKAVISIVLMWISFPILMMRFIVTVIYMFLFFIAKTEPFSVLAKELLIDVLVIAVLAAIFIVIHKYGGKKGSK